MPGQLPDPSASNAECKHAASENHLSAVEAAREGIDAAVRTPAGARRDELGANRETGTPAAAAARARRRRRWRNILCGGSSREVLARLMQGDPLDLASCVEARLRVHALLFDVERVTLRSAAQCARQALGYRGDPSIDRWIEQCVDDALLGLQQEDCEAQRSGRSPGAEQLAAFEALARPLGLEPRDMHRVCVVHNRLPRVERIAFRDVVLDGRSLDDLAAGRGTREVADELLSATDWARAARRALQRVLECLEPTQSAATGASEAARSRPRATGRGRRRALPRGRST